MKNTKKITFIAMVAITASFILISCKKNTKDEQPISSQNFTMAKTNKELVALQDNPNVNIIRSINDLDAIVSQTALSKLSSEELLKFKNGIVVRAGVGVVSIKYGILKEKLNYEEFSDVMGWFGLDIKQGFWGFSNNPSVMKSLSAQEEGVEGEIEAPGTDYKEYYCSHPYNCKALKDAICMSKC